MTVVRVHHYTVDPADLETFLARRTELITAVQQAHPGLAATTLISLEDGAFTDTWRWKSTEQLVAALPATSSPEAAAAMSLTRDATALNGEIIDET